MRYLHDTGRYGERTRSAIINNAPFRENRIYGVFAEKTPDRLARDLPRSGKNLINIL
jgi:hypothetical protein